MKKLLCTLLVLSSVVSASMASEQKDVATGNMKKSLIFNNIKSISPKASNLQCEQLFSPVNLIVPPKGSAQLASNMPLEITKFHTLMSMKKEACTKTCMESGLMERQGTSRVSLDNGKTYEVVSTTFNGKLSKSTRITKGSMTVGKLCVADFISTSLS